MSRRRGQRIAWRGPSGAGGEAAFDPVIRLNGMTVLGSVYFASDINVGTGAWAPRYDGLSIGSLALQAGTPSYDQRSPLDAGVGNDVLVVTDATAWWKAAAGPVMGTRDLVAMGAYQFRYQTAGAGYRDIMCTTSGSNGWAMYEFASGATQPNFRFWKGWNLVTSGANLSGEPFVVQVDCLNRDENSTNGQKHHINGILYDSDNPYANNGNLTDEHALKVGAGYGGAYAGTTLAALGIWMADSLFSAGATGAAEMLALAQRFATQLGGLYPTVARAGGFASPTVTRASNAGHKVTRGGIGRLWQLGAGLLVADDVGVPIWGAATNTVVQSQTLATTWSKLDAGDTVTNADGTAPSGDATATSLVADATDGDHGVSQAATVTAAVWTFSVWAKAGNKNWLYLSDDTVANATCYFDLATPAVGTAGAGAVGAIVDEGEGWIRCSITFTGTAASHTFKIQTADADGDKTVQGNGSTKNTYLFGAQLELGSTPSPYIVTVAAPATRNATALSYPIAMIPSQPFSVEFKFTLPDHTPDAARYLFSISDGTSDHHFSASVATDGSLDIDTNENGGSAGHIDLAGDYADGVEHTLRIALGPTALYARVDGGAVGSDTSVTFPAGWTSWKIGARYDSTLYLNGHISSPNDWLIREGVHL